MAQQMYFFSTIYVLISVKYNGTAQNLVLAETIELFVCFLGVTTLWLYFTQPGSALQPPCFRGFLITHNDAPQSVELLWTSDESVAETST